MREWFQGLFRKDIGTIRMNAFDGWHFMYIFIVLGVAIGLAFILKNKSKEAKERAVSNFLIAAIVLYIMDFFCMPFSEGGVISMDKLPFHICTSVSIIAGLAHFNKHFKWLKGPAVALCVVAPLMYITYPGTALDGKFPFCYTVMQTMFYHGALLGYGILALATGEVKLKFKNIWKELLLIIAIACWAAFGNYVYEGVENWGSDWFFLKGGAFLAYMGVPQWLIPILVVSSVFGMVALIYGIYYLVCFIIKKINAKKLAVVSGNSLEANNQVEETSNVETEEENSEINSEAKEEANENSAEE